MTNLLVVAAGPATTFQDGGRPGHLRHGVPRSGPVDRLAHRLAARLAGRVAGEVATTVGIEVHSGTCVLRPQQQAADLAVTGAGASLELDGHAVPAPCVVRVPAGSDVRVHSDVWAYVVPAGDLEVPETLGSRSHHPRSGTGPSISDGTAIAVGPARPVRRGRWPDLELGHGALAVLAAPQTDWFTPEALRRLATAAFATTHHTDRMGARLDGPALRSDRGHDVVSDGIVPGTIQVDGAGRATVLLADHQSAGGYPKVAVLSSAALARFVRMPPGRAVRFVWTDPVAARADWRAVRQAVEAVVGTAPRPGAPALASEDLTTDGLVARRGLEPGGG